MFDEALFWSRPQGYGRMVLWTRESYRAAGRHEDRDRFLLVAWAPAHAFGLEVVDQTWGPVL